MEQILIEAVLREDREVIRGSPCSSTKGKSCLPNRMVYDGLTILVELTDVIYMEQLEMTFIWTSVKPLTQCMATFCSLNWKEMDLMGGPFNEYVV